MAPFEDNTPTLVPAPVVYNRFTPLTDNNAIMLPSEIENMTQEKAGVDETRTQGCLAAPKEPEAPLLYLRPMNHQVSLQRETEQTSLIKCYRLNMPWLAQPKSRMS